MSWHEGHDVRYMIEEPSGPGSLSGPYCRDCQEAGVMLVYPKTLFDLIGFALVALVLASQWLRKK